jgi:hypothetical protein
MESSKKILIIAIIGLFIFILICLLKKRREILNSEGLTNQSGLSEVTKLKSKTGSGISSLIIDNLDLCEYCIKSSYNTALSGNYVSNEMIKYVLERGCRFLDFEIFYINNVPCVAYSKDPTFVTITSSNYITLNEALKMVIVNGFSGPSPNSEDPLFIQFRIKSTDSAIYNMIGMAVTNYLKSRLYEGPVNGTTSIKSLMGKIVLIIDKQIAPDYANSDNYPICNDISGNCYNLSKFSNMESGGGNLRMYTYDNLLNQVITPPTILDSDKNDTDITLLRLVEPDIKDTSNPNNDNFILNYGVQFIANRFYVNDKNLIEYEKIFFDNKSAFVPYAKAIRYLHE